MTLGNTDNAPLTSLDKLFAVQAIIFDVDGTLYDQRALHRRMAARIVAAHWSRPVAAFRVARAIQAYRKAHEQLRNQPFSAELQLARAAAECGYSSETVRRAIEEWFEGAPLALLPDCVYAQVPAFLELLRNLRIKCGVFSDYPADAKLASMKLGDFFLATLCAAKVGRQKPDPAGLLAVARAMGVAPEHTLHLGDRASDLEAAANAGMLGYLVTAGHNYSTLQKWFANYSSAAIQLHTS